MSSRLKEKTGTERTHKDLDAQSVTERVDPHQRSVACNQRRLPSASMFSRQSATCLLTDESDDAVYDLVLPELDGPGRDLAHSLAPSPVREPECKRG